MNDYLIFFQHLHNYDYISKLVIWFFGKSWSWILRTILIIIRGLFLFLNNHPTLVFSLVWTKLISRFIMNPYTFITTQPPCSCRKYIYLYKVSFVNFYRVPLLKRRKFRICISKIETIWCPINLELHNLWEIKMIERRKPMLLAFHYWVIFWIKKHN